MSTPPIFFEETVTRERKFRYCLKILSGTTKSKDTIFFEKKNVGVLVPFNDIHLVYQNQEGIEKLNLSLDSLL